MILLYIVLITYILAVNFYSFLYILALRKAEKAASRAEVVERPSVKSFEPSFANLAPKVSRKQNASPATDANASDETEKQSNVADESEKRRDEPEKRSLTDVLVPKKPKGFDWKLLVCSALGGAITVYVCAFIFKYKLNDLFFMIVTPVLAAINGYLWFLLFSSGFFMKI